MQSLWMILEGIVLGLISAVPIGPVNVQIARRSLTQGFWSGASVGFGAAFIDCVYAVIACIGIGQLINYDLLYQPLRWAGSILLLAMAGFCFVSAVKHLNKDPFNDAATPVGSMHGGFASGALMVMLNPATLAYWMFVVPRFALDRNHTLALPMICTGVVIGTFGWVVTFAGLFRWIGRFRKRWWTAAADATGGVALTAFAVYLLWRSPTPHL
jgi:threonine/homoserine/homoserine lactone efflux protein